MSVKKLAQGAFILTCANVVTRIIGFLYRIFMSNAIGSEGMGLYQLIMPVYMLAWSISSSGITTAVSKLTAEENGKSKGNSEKTVFCALFISLIISLFLSISVFAFSDTISSCLLKEPRTSSLLKILSLCFPFMACGSCIRGYFYGMQKHIYPAAAQVFEQVIRIATVIMLYPFFFSKGMEYACAAAVTGITTGEFCAFMLTAVFLKSNKVHKKSSVNSYFSAAPVLLSVAMPLTLTKMSASLLSAVENVLIPTRLKIYSSSVNSLALFGSLTGMTLPLIQFPSSVLIAISSTLMPAISSAAASGRKNSVEKAVEKSLSFTSAMSFFAFGFFFVFSKEICQIIYHRPELGNLLKKLAFLCPLIYTNITLNGILNGIGKHTFIFLNSLAASFINITAIYFLIPQIGMEAYIISSAAGLVFSCTMGLKKCIDKNNILNVIFQNFILPLCCCICGINICKFFYTENFIINISIFGAVYFLLLVFSNAGGIGKDLIKIIKMRIH